MTARILVVDDTEANILLLQAYLSKEYYEVITASNGVQALQLIEQEQPDLVLLDVMMQGMDGFEVCRRIKSSPKSLHVPVVLVTALEQVSDRHNGLNAGADDFISKPVNETALMARVRSLARLKMMADELRLRQMTTNRLENIQEDISLELLTHPLSPVLVLSSNVLINNRIQKAMHGYAEVELCEDKNIAMQSLQDKEYCVLVIDIDDPDFDGLRICSHLRSTEDTRHICIIALVNEENTKKMVKALDMGVHDYVHKPIDYHELLARTRTQVRRYNYSTSLRNMVESSMKFAITDTLTGMYNRRYMETHMKSLMDRSMTGKLSGMALCILDIDFFKSINDTYGHDAGDIVLQQFAAVIRDNVRNIDLPVRMGGEEFVVVMPETSLQDAIIAAERLRLIISDMQIYLPEHEKSIQITVSIGIACLDIEKEEDGPHLIKRADLALYRAKKGGRNRVILHRGGGTQEA